ncbi:MAG TPA: glycine cleavage T C-terminal barrel domain-containing protein [Pyrinomonadaceae bacterium]|nr:glycine cleavage T C-terminal barrel domain-containing protein [Pyrinomonadaceae bacterium]
MSEARVINQKLNAEYAAVRDGGVGLIDLSARGRISVSGSEAVMFLNGLITNDIKTLAENRWMAAVFPNVQGRLLAAVRVIRRHDDFLLDTEAVTHEKVLKLIARFTLAGNFKVADLTHETRQISFQGRGAGELIENVYGVKDLPRDGVWQDENVTIIRATHTGEDGFDVINGRDSLETFGATHVSPEVEEILRIEAGIARYGIDMDETNVVTETNLDDAVSYTKGCYLGQEIIVRIKHRGHVAKKLTGLRFENEEPIETGAVIKSVDDKEIGRITSVTFSPKLQTTVGLGYVRYEHLAPGTPILVDNVAGSVQSLPLIPGSWYER